MKHKKQRINNNVQMDTRFLKLISLWLGLTLALSHALPASMKPTTSTTTASISNSDSAENLNSIEDPSSLGYSSMQDQVSGQDIVISSLDDSPADRHKYEQTSSSTTTSNGDGGGSVIESPIESQAENNKLESRSETVDQQQSHNDNSNSNSDPLIIDHRPAPSDPNSNVDLALGGLSGSDVNQPTTPPTSTQTPPATTSSPTTVITVNAQPLVPATQSPQSNSHGQQEARNSNQNSQQAQVQQQAQNGIQGWSNLMGSASNLMPVQVVSPLNNNNNPFVSNNNNQQFQSSPNSINAIINEQQQQNSQQNMQQANQLAPAATNPSQQIQIAAATPLAGMAMSSSMAAMNPGSGPFIGPNGQLVQNQPVGGGRRISLTGWLRNLSSMLANIFNRRDHGLLMAANSAPGGQWIQLGPSAPHWLTQAQTFIQSGQQQLMGAASSANRLFLPAPSSQMQMQQQQNTANQNQFDLQTSSSSQTLNYAPIQQQQQQQIPNQAQVAFQPAQMIAQTQSPPQPLMTMANTQPTTKSTTNSSQQASSSNTNHQQQQQSRQQAPNNVNLKNRAPSQNQVSSSSMNSSVNLQSNLPLAHYSRFQNSGVAVANSNHHQQQQEANQ